MLRELTAGGQRRQLEEEMRKPCGWKALTSGLGALLGTLALAAVLAGMNAAIATAEPGCGGAENITGAGSKWGEAAQNSILIPDYEALCATPNIKYEATGDLAAMEAWNSEGGPEEINTSYAFLTTDLAPNAEQVKDMQAPAGGGKVSTYPLLQVGIVLAIHPPKGCSLAKIENKSLEEVFRGTMLKWREVPNISDAKVGGKCDSAITRVVSKDGSAVAYWIKVYLSQINNNNLKCTKPVDNWTVLSKERPNNRWPEKTQCAKVNEEPEISVLVKKEDGQETAEYLDATEGTIGYILTPNLPKLKTATEPSVQNNGTGTESVTYSEPVVTEGENVKANCASSQKVYEQSMPKNGEGKAFPATEAGWIEAGKAANVDWSETAGLSTNASSVTGVSSAYPMCIFEYGLAWEGYSSVGYPAETGKAVANYFGYAVKSTEGQTKLSTSGYAPLFTRADLAAGEAVARIK